MADAHAILLGFSSGKAVAQRSWMVEGRPCLGLRDDVRLNGIEIARHVVCHDAQSDDPVRSQFMAPDEIKLRAVSAITRFAVDLDCDYSRLAVEIQDGPADGILLPELRAARPAAKHAPQQDLRQAHRAAQTTGGLPRSVHCLLHRIAPPSACGWSPSPRNLGEDFAGSI